MCKSPLPLANKAKISFSSQTNKFSSRSPPFHFLGVVFKISIKLTKDREGDGESQNKKSHVFFCFVCSEIACLLQVGYTRHLHVNSIRNIKR